MRVLFAALDAYGHLLPLIPLAKAACEAGHEVLFATAATRHSLLRSTGIPAAEASVSTDEAFHEAYVRHTRPVSGSGPGRELTEEGTTRLISEVVGSVLARRCFEHLMPIVRSFSPDVMIWEPHNFGAAFAAHATSTPGGCHGISLLTKDPLLDEITAAAAETAADLLGPACAPAAEQIRGDFYLDIFPGSLQHRAFAGPPNRLPLRPHSADVPGHDPEVVAWARDRSRPLVYLTMGTVYGTPAALAKAVSAVAGLAVDVLVSTGPKTKPGELPAVPKNALVVPWVPQTAILPYVDLAVHHGGSGTTLAALAAGIPQVFLPQGADQFINADAVCAAGAGSQLPAEHRSAGSLAETARILLTDRPARAAASALAAEIAAMPSPAETLLRIREQITGPSRVR